MRDEKRAQNAPETIDKDQVEIRGQLGQPRDHDEEHESDHHRGKGQDLDALPEGIGLVLPDLVVIQENDGREGEQV